MSDESGTRMTGGENPVCSFCGKSKEEAGCPVFVGTLSEKGICFDCVKKADEGGYPVAFCASCKVENGKHASSCTEGKGCA